MLHIIFIFRWSQQKKVCFIAMSYKNGNRIRASMATLQLHLFAETRVPSHDSAYIALLSLSSISLSLTLSISPLLALFRYILASTTWEHKCMEIYVTAGKPIAYYCPQCDMPKWLNVIVLITFSWPLCLFLFSSTEWKLFCICIVQ